MVPDKLPDTSAILRLSMAPGQLPKLEQWLREFAERTGLSSQSVFRLELVLTEAVTNVMSYARQPGKSGEIEVVCGLQDGCIMVKLEDDGPHFDPTTHTQGPPPNTLEEATPGGLGIHLIRQYTTDMDYRRERDHNVLYLTLPVETATPSV